MSVNSINFGQHYKTCPACKAEDVQKSAAFCTYCAFNFVTRKTAEKKDERTKEQQNADFKVYMEFGGVPKDRAIELENDAMQWLEDPSHNPFNMSIHDPQFPLAEFLIMKTRELKMLKELAQVKFKRQQQELVHELESERESNGTHPLGRSEEQTSKLKKKVTADKTLPKPLRELRKTIVDMGYDGMIPGFMSMDYIQLKEAFRKVSMQKD